MECWSSGFRNINTPSLQNSSTPTLRLVAAAPHDMDWYDTIYLRGGTSHAPGHAHVDRSVGESRFAGADYQAGGPAHADGRAALAGAGSRALI